MISSIRAQPEILPDYAGGPGVSVSILKMSGAFM